MVAPPPYQAVIPASVSVHKVNIEIVDDSKGDYVEKVGANGKVVTVFDRYNLARCRLRCAVRRWVVEQLAPNGFAHVEPKGLSDVEPE